MFDVKIEETSCIGASVAFLFVGNGFGGFSPCALGLDLLGLADYTLRGFSFGGVLLLLFLLFFSCFYFLLRCFVVHLFFSTARSSASSCFSRPPAYFSCVLSSVSP